MLVAVAPADSELRSVGDEFAWRLVFEFIVPYALDDVIRRHNMYLNFYMQIQDRLPGRSCIQGTQMHLQPKQAQGLDRG